MTALHAGSTTAAFVIWLLAFIPIVTLSFKVFAAEPTEETNIIYFEDGSYIT